MLQGDLNKKTYSAPPRRKFYSRLQLRKSRRMKREFYTQVKTERLADIVLGYLDDAITDAESLL
jgi:hypothetical protein